MLITMYLCFASLVCMRKVSSREKKMNIFHENIEKFLTFQKALQMQKKHLVPKIF